MLHILYSSSALKFTKSDHHLEIVYSHSALHLMKYDSGELGPGT